MRVAYISMDAGVPVFGKKGCSVHVQEIIRAFKQRGAEVELFTPRLGGDAPADLKSIKVHKLPALPKTKVNARELAAQELNLDLREALEKSQAFDLVYERYSLWSYAAIAWAKTNTIPSILEVNAPLIEEQEKHRELIDKKSAEVIAETIFSSASTVVAVSEEVAEYVQTRAQSNLHVVANGVNLTRFSPKVAARLAANKDLLTVGFVGTLKPWHGLDTLICAQQLLEATPAKIKLLIVGDGPEKDRLEAMLSVEQKKKVVFTGAVDPEEVPDLLATMDVAVAPYPALDNFYFSPLKLYEYMAMGLAVVASNIGQIQNVVKDAENGLLYEAGNVQSLADKLRELSSKPELRSSLARQARLTAERHSWDAALSKMLSTVNLLETYVTP